MTWKFRHKEASPRYPQPNGNVKNVVKTIKQLIKKCHESVSQSTLHSWIGATCHQRVLGHVHHNIFLLDVVRYYSLLQDQSFILVILKKTPGRSIFKNI